MDAYFTTVTWSRDDTREQLVLLRTRIAQTNISSCPLDLFVRLKPVSIFGGLSTIIIEQVTGETGPLMNTWREGKYKIFQIIIQINPNILLKFLSAHSFNKACSFSTCLELVPVKVHEYRQKYSYIVCFCQIVRGTFLNRPASSTCPEWVLGLSREKSTQLP